MKRDRLFQSTGYVRILASLLAATAVALSATVSTAAEKPTKRVGPEVAVGGITAEEHAAWQSELSTKLMAEMPEGALQSPIRVELTDKDRADLAAPAVSGTPLVVGVVKAMSPAIEVADGQGFKPGVIQATKGGGLVWAVTVTS